jgi:FAD synthase
VLGFREKLRDEEAFATPEALVKQMKRDIDETRRILSQEVG